jgi:hypothetical protein
MLTVKITYSTSEGGTDDSGNSFVAQLAVEFRCRPAAAGKRQPAGRNR